jgi:hypothetical protein
MVSAKSAIEHKLGDLEKHTLIEKLILLLLILSFVFWLLRFDLTLKLKELT